MPNNPDSLPGCNYCRYECGDECYTCRLTHQEIVPGAPCQAQSEQELQECAKLFSYAQLNNPYPDNSKDKSVDYR